MGIRTGARTALAILAGVFAVLLLIQVFLAGLGVFDGPERFATHRDFGYGISLLIIVMIVLSIVGRGPARLIGLSVLLEVQILLQSVFIVMRADNPQVAALHPVNGVLMLVVSLVLAREAWAARLEGQGAAEATGPAADVQS
jgi:hypothetical protein